MASHDRQRKKLPIIEFVDHRLAPDARHKNYNRTRSVPVFYARFIDRNKYTGEVLRELRRRYLGGN